MDFFGIGFGEILLVLIIALIVFGPGRLPEAARTIGKYARLLRRMSSEFTDAVKKEMDIDDDVKSIGSDLKAMRKDLDVREDVRKLGTNLKAVPKIEADATSGNVKTGADTAKADGNGAVPLPPTGPGVSTGRTGEAGASEPGA